MKLALAILSIMLLAGGLSANEIDLSGPWKFHVDIDNTGIQKGWQKTDFDASSWRTLSVPGDWESQGITQINPEWQQSDDLKQPYTGYAWYRRTVEIPADWKGKNVILNLGQVDDLDWTYFNGRLVGETTDRSGWVSSVQRSYQVPAAAIKFGGPNTIAVRVLDFRGLGGIRGGPVNLSNQVVEAPAQGGQNQNDSVQVGGDVTVQTNQTVNDAVAVWGNVTVMGHVQGDAVAVGGNVSLFPGSRVDGDVVAVGGKVNRQTGAVVGGQVTGIGPSLRHFPVAPNHGNNPLSSNNPFFWPLWNPLAIFILLVAAIFHLVISIIAAALFPDRVETIGSTVLEKPGMTLLYGFVGYLLVLPLTLLLVVTCIGIPLVAVEFVILLAAKIMGRAGVGLAVGRKVGVGFNHPISSTILAVIVGALVIGFIQLIPFLGWLVSLVLGMFGLGAVIMTGFGVSADWFSRRYGGRRAPISDQAPVQQ